jgi:hypothetical protein
MSEEKPDKKLRVMVTARPRPGGEHTHYNIPGHRLRLGGPAVEVEVSELELSWLKADTFIVVEELGGPPAEVTPIVQAPTPAPPKEDPGFQKAPRMRR